MSGSGRWSSRAASASVARAQSRLERAFILHTLAIRERFRAGETEMFLPNSLMVPWHAYVACTGILAATVASLGAASWDALLAVAEMDDSEANEGDEADADEPPHPFVARLREVHVEDEAVGTRL